MNFNWDDLFVWAFLFLAGGAYIFQLGIFA
jgi:hypothetical protein